MVWFSCTTAFRIMLPEPVSSANGRISGRAARSSGGAVRRAMSASRATPFCAAVCALALLPVPVSGQAPSAREQLVWHWFGGCTSGDSLKLEFHVDGALVYSSTFPICHVHHSEIKPEPQQRLLTFQFDAAPHRFGTQYRASEPEPITGSVWEAGQRRTAVVLGVSFATAERVLLNTRHMARPDSPARSEWIRGLELITRPVRRAERTPPSKRMKRRQVNRPAA
jgi:hypothetical protein